MRTSLLLLSLLVTVGCKRDALNADSDLDTTDVDTGDVDTDTDFDTDSDTDVDTDTDAPVDADNDGFTADVDCNDDDATVFPGADEQCNGVDDDCDDLIDNDAIDAPTLFPDADFDGYGDPDGALTACDINDTYVADNTDCDDANADINPMADEVCNSLDDNCDDVIDTDAVDMLSGWLDIDRDQYGDPDAPVMGCTLPRDTVFNADDCGPDDSTVNPDADEVCNSIDDNCDGIIDTDALDVQSAWMDLDRDGFGDPDTPVSGCVLPREVAFNDGDCGPFDPDVNPDADEVCNSIDDNCDGTTDTDAIDIRTGWSDFDRDGFGDPDSPVRGCQLPLDTVDNDDDCGPDDFAVNPNADEVCNGIDDNCDDVTDTDAIDAQTGWADLDQDGFGDPDSPVQGCRLPPDTVDNDGDCSPRDPAINPDALEACDGMDNDCSGTPDDNEAIGDAAACAVQDCWEAQDAGRGSSPTWILWNQRTPFEVYCEQEVDGGGWALVFKNHGGAVPGEANNQTLLESDYEGSMVSPHAEELISDINTTLWNQVRGQQGLTFLKMGTLYGSRGEVEAETTLRIDFDENTWDDILAARSGQACTEVTTPFVVTANGQTPLGSTTFINSYQGSRATFGLANSGHGTADSCGQEQSNLINDPDDVLPRVDTGDSLNGIRHVFSYVHTAGNLRDASRCQFACWNEDNWGGRYDAFTWGVRQPRR